MLVRELSVWDVRPLDLALAVTTAALVLLAAGLALRHSALAQSVDAPTIDPGIGVPVRVRPVLDVGRPVGTTATRPPTWRRKKPKPPPQSPTASPTPTTTPQPDKQRTTQSTEELPSLDEIFNGSEEPASDADPNPPSADPNAPEGPTDPNAEPGGEVPGDGIQGRIISAYRQRLIRWLAERFRVRGSGLSPAELERHRVRATIEIDAQGIIVGYTVADGAQEDFEIAAYATLEGLKGEAVPRPPDDYPGPLQHKIQVTFACKRSVCS